MSTNENTPQIIQSLIDWQQSNFSEKSFEDHLHNIDLIQFKINSSINSNMFDFSLQREIHRIRRQIQIGSLVFIRTVHRHLKYSFKFKTTKLLMIFKISSLKESTFKILIAKVDFDI